MNTSCCQSARNMGVTPTGGSLASRSGQKRTKVVSGVAEETDDDNFKSEVACHQCRAAADFEHSLHDVRDAQVAEVTM